MKEVASEASSSQLVENESGFYGDVPLDQLEIGEEGATQTVSIKKIQMKDKSKPYSSEECSPLNHLQLYYSKHYFNLYRFTILLLIK